MLAGSQVWAQVKAGQGLGATVPCPPTYRRRVETQTQQFCASGSRPPGPDRCGCRSEAPDTGLPQRGLSHLLMDEALGPWGTVLCFRSPKPCHSLCLKSSYARVPKMHFWDSTEEPYFNWQQSGCFLYHTHKPWKPQQMLHILVSTVIHIFKNKNYLWSFWLFCWFSSFLKIQVFFEYHYPLPWGASLVFLAEQCCWGQTLLVSLNLWCLYVTLISVGYLHWLDSFFLLKIFPQCLCPLQFLMRNLYLIKLLSIYI